MQIVGIVLLHNEDVHAERVIRNVAAFCDRLHVADHASTDRTWVIVSGLAAELGNVEAVRISHAPRSHDLVLPLGQTRGCSARTATSSSTRQVSGGCARSSRPAGTGSTGLRDRGMNVLRRKPN